jgi:hypothetical protein
MHATERFMKFAAECEVMAKFTRSPESRAVWNGLAQRWIRCARLADQTQITTRHGGPAKRQHTSARDLSH